jgi:hypothetical protein
MGSTSRMILNHLHHLLVLDRAGLVHSGRDTTRISATEEDVAKLRAEFPDVPSDYIDIVKDIDGVDIEYEVSGRSKFYISILTINDVLAYTTEWYPFLKRDMPECFFFGQAGDSSYLLGEYDGLAGVYVIETSVPTWKYAEYIAPSIKSLLCDGVGWAPVSS